MNDTPRTPRFSAFIGTGVVIGVLLGIWMSLREPGGPSYVDGMRTATDSGVLFLAAFGAFIGAGLGALVAVLLDRTGRGPST